MWHFHEPRKIKSSKHHHHSHSHDKSNSSSPRSRSRSINQAIHDTIDLHANGHTSSDHCLSFDPSEYVMTVKTGYLWKESSTLNNVVSLAWRQKWFTLSSTLLSYYDHRDDPHPKEAIDCTNLIVKKDTRPDKEFCFSIMQPTQYDGFVDTTVISLAAANEQEMNSWVEAIRNNILHDARLTRAYQDRIDHLEAIVQTLQEKAESASVDAELNTLHAADVRSNNPSDNQSNNQTVKQLNQSISIMEAFRMREMIGLLQQENKRLKAEVQRIRFDNSINPATYRANQSNITSNIPSNVQTNTPPANNHLAVSTSFSADNSPSHVGAVTQALDRLTASTPIPPSPVTDTISQTTKQSNSRPSTPDSSASVESQNDEVTELKRQLAVTRSQLDRTKAERKILKDECLRLRRVLAEANKTVEVPVVQPRRASMERLVVTQPIA